MTLFNFNQLIEEIVGTKPLRNTENTRSDALLRAEKADNALKTYPFADISADLVLKINPRAKRMALRVDPKKHLVNLVVPKRASMKQAYLFALEHKYWIRQKLDELPSSIPFANGTIIPLLGQNREIKITFDSTLKTTRIDLKNKELLVFTNKPDPAARIKRFIITLAKEHLTTLSHEKAAQTGKTIQSVTVKDTASRWGSCSQDAELCYSWRLIFAPTEAFDYVVAHEVSHLTYMDHAPDFWHLCEDIADNYSKGKNWMKRHGGDLIRYN